MLHLLEERLHKKHRLLVSLGFNVRFYLVRIFEILQQILKHLSFDRLVLRRTRPFIFKLEVLLHRGMLSATMLPIKLIVKVVSQELASHQVLLLRLVELLAALE